MSINNSLGYCPVCKQNVLLIREAANWPLIILLLIFTGGIGLIVYAVIYFNKPPNRCIHCRSQIALTPTGGVQTSNQILTNTQLRQANNNAVVDSKEDFMDPLQKYCSFCGERIINKEAQFCAHCGSKV
jgi:hypothetical protein